MSSFYLEAEITDVQKFTTATAGASGPQYYVESNIPFDDVVILRVNTSTDTLVSQLVEGTDYTIINSRLIEFPSNPASALGPNEEYRMYTINPAKDNLNPCKVIDIKQKRVVHDVPIWDPIRNHQYAIANNLVDIENTVDPASYTDSLDSSKTNNEFWNEPEVGTIWWDVSKRDYIPYNDHYIFDIDDRVQNWGKQADWSAVKLYQWTKSDVPPSEWNDVAVREELDSTIDPKIRKTGRAKVETFQRVRSVTNVVQRTNTTQDIFPTTATDGPPNTITVNDSSGNLRLGDRVVLTTTGELPAPLETNKFYWIVSRTPISGSQVAIQLSEQENGEPVEIIPGALLVQINIAQSDPRVGSDPTQLTNDFNTSGYQDVLLSGFKSANSLTGLNPGTSGYQDVTFPSSINAATSTNFPVTVGEEDGRSTFVYSGYVSETGVGSNLPDNWVVTRSGADNNIYTVTHNLGHTNYNPVVTTYNDLVTFPFDGYTATIVELDEDYFVYRTFSTDENGLPLPAAAHFIVADYTAVEATAYQTVSAFVSVNGEPPQRVEVTRQNAPTIGALIIQLNAQLEGVTVSLGSNYLRFTSDTGGDSSSISITDIDLFSTVVSGGTTIGTAVPGVSVAYTTAVAIDNGGQQVLTILGDQAQTYGDLIDALAISGATPVLQYLPSTGDSAIRIRSNRTGAHSSVDIDSSIDDLFQSLSDFDSFDTPHDGVNATTYTLQVSIDGAVRTASVVGNRAQTWSELFDVLNPQINNILTVTPDGNFLLSSNDSTIEILNSELFDCLGETAGSPTTLVIGYVPQNTGSGSHQVVPPFRDEDWVQLEDITKKLFGARDNNGSNQFNLAVAGTAPNNIQAGDVVDIYVNGHLHQEKISVGAGGLTSIPSIKPYDFIVVRKEKHVLTNEERDFNPDVLDDGTKLIQYKEDYNYSQTTRIDEFDNQVPVYYFWVENKTVRENNNISMRQAVADLKNIPTPYVILDKLLDETATLPRRYTQLIVRGLAGVVDDEDRYVLRFTKDFSLRDKLHTRNYTSDLPNNFAQVGTQPVGVKTLHTEWALIREKQLSPIPRELWDKITESIIARKLEDPSSRVPSLARELYDLSHGTDTRYGLGEDQAFVDGSLAIATILHDLQDPTNDFSPININSFFASHDFDTEQGIVKAMDDIYESFPADAVNRIFFKVLLDALTTKQDYPDIFKTSWVALSGTQVLQTEALYSG